MEDTIHPEDVKSLKQISEMLLGRFDIDEIAEIVGLAYSVGRNRGQLEGAIRVATTIGAA